MSSSTVVAALLLCAAPGLAEAGSFSIIGNVPNNPLIGAARYNTVYGVTQSGTPILFSLAANAAPVTLHSFASGNDGITLLSPLVRDSLGGWNGMAKFGGTNGQGTLWRYGTDSGFSVLHDFGANGDGSYPLVGPAIDTAGNFYGSTSGGAVATNGMTFEYNAHGAYSALHDFLSGSDGHCPFSGVAVSQQGTVYGTTVGNGFGGNPNGSVWQIKNGGALATLYVFTDGADGQYPTQTPTLDDFGNLWGTTTMRNGGTVAGVVWKISSTGSFSVVHSFDSAAEGAQPNSPLVLARGGLLYGTTATGGPGGYGTLFSIGPAGVLRVVHAFANGTDGASPNGGLVRNPYGTVFGAVSSGQVFEYAP